MNSRNMNLSSINFRIKISICRDGKSKFQNEIPEYEHFELIYPYIESQFQNEIPEYELVIYQLSNKDINMPRREVKISKLNLGIWTCHL